MATKHQIMTQLCILALGLSSVEAAANSGSEAALSSDPALQARGVLKPVQTANIAAGMSGRLIRVPYKSGQYVKKGQEIAAFDCARQEAELSARQQAHATAALQYDNQAELLSMGAAGALDVSIAKSERDQLQAEIRVIEVALRDCIITAPFSGYVSARTMQAYETPQIGQPIYSLLRAGRPEMSVIVPSEWASWVKAGQSFEFKVDETGESFTAKVVRLGAEIDPVSQTLEITATPAKTIKAKPGMSGIARFEQP